MKRTESWHIILALSAMVIYSEALAGFQAFRINLNENLVVARLIHLIIGVGVGATVLFLRKKLSSRVSTISFLLLVIPWIPISWYSQVYYVASQKPFVPLVAFKLYPIVLAFLVPGSYWLNLIFIIIFYIEAACVWIFLDMPHQHQLVAGSEPYLTLTYAFIAFTLIYFRYKDEKMMQELIKNQAQSDFYRNLVRIFHTMRDRTNNPLQIQKLISHQLRIRNPQDADLIDKMDGSIERLQYINKILTRLEKGVHLEDTDLMKEEDIMSFLDKLENDHHHER